ncbi:MAG TPA: efflux RND transporter periplasmic adaptor subunit [Vicinamibacterales bacterium]|nr:efflux RND transporter periplasmic adaptor subunit [Vicinamibacterales bacterium]
MSMLITQVELPRHSRQWAAALRVAFSVLVLGLGMACGGAPDNAGAAAGGGRGRGGPVPVEIQTLVEKPVEQTSEFVGTVKSLKTTTVQSQVEGFLLKVHVKSGDRVEPGKVLFEVDASSQQAAVSSLESVRVAREADAIFARQQAERAKKLLAVGAMSQQEHDQAQTLQRTAEAQLKAVDEQLRQQKNEFGYSRVTAGAPGVIGDVPVRVGDRITKSTPLTTIEDNSGLELYLNIPVQEAVRLKLGLPVKFLDSNGAEIVTERVNFISPSVDETTQTVLVKTPAATRGGAFRSDQFVRARVIWSSAPALTVPVGAVSRISGQFFAFVAEPGDGGQLIAHLRPITVGTLANNEYLVTGGLKAGDKVIVAGTQKIGEGAPVTAAPPPPPGGRGAAGGSE